MTQAESTATSKSFPRLNGFLLLLLPLLAFAFGLWGNWPWLVAEHQRLEPWKVPLIWLSEGTALFWYTQYVTLCLLYGQSNLVFSPEPSGKTKAFRILWITTLVGLAGDVGVTLLTVFEENSAYSSAVVVEARVVQDTGRTLRRSGRVLHTLTCQFVDGQGLTHQAILFPHSLQLPDNVLQGNRPLPLLYDPAWPGRCWIKDSSVPHHNRLYFMSFCTALFNGILAAIFIALAMERSQRFPVPLKVCPFLAVALVLFMSGCGKFLTGESP